MANQIVHWELMGPDGDQLKDFYGGLFGWATQPVDGFDNYNMVDADQAGIGGAIGKGPAEMPNYLTFYVQVDNVDDHLAKVAAAGGATMVPKTVIPGIVTFAIFTDPAGNAVGLVEAETAAAGD